MNKCIMKVTPRVLGNGRAFDILIMRRKAV